MKLFVPARYRCCLISQSKGFLRSALADVNLHQSQLAS